MPMMMVIVALLRFSLLLVVVITVDYCMCVFGICQSDVGVRTIVSHSRGHVSHWHVITSRTHIPSTVANTANQACFPQASRTDN